MTSVELITCPVCAGYGFLVLGGLRPVGETQEIRTSPCKTCYGTGLTPRNPMQWPVDANGSYLE